MTGREVGCGSGLHTACARAVAVVEYGIVMSRARGGLSVGECCVIDRDS